MTSIDPTSAMRALVAAHDELVDEIGGEAYVTVTASWRAGEDSPLTTLSYSTIDPDEHHPRCRIGIRDEYGVARPTEDPDEGQEAPPTYTVAGGQGHMILARHVSLEEAERIRRVFDRKCAAAGLLNPPTLIRREGQSTDEVRDVLGSPDD